MRVFTVLSNHKDSNNKFDPKKKKQDKRSLKKYKKFTY